MDGCQNYDPFLGTLNIRCRIKLGPQKGTITLTTTHIVLVYEDVDGNMDVGLGFAYYDYECHPPACPPVSLCIEVVGF